MAPLWSFQPFKAIYTVFILLTAPPRLALLSIRYLIKPLRPLPDWGVRANLVSDTLRLFLGYIFATRSQLILSKDPRTAKERHSRVDPPAEDLFAGVLEGSRHEGIRPAPVDVNVVLHFPGGAFTHALSHERLVKSATDSFATHMKASRTVWAQYRLSGTPETRFPAALQDAVTAYQHVLSLGIDPGNITLSGDSAGGNIALALLRYLESSSSSLPLPGGAAVFSPWVHVTAHAGHDHEQCRNSRSDALVASLLQWGAESYLPLGRVAEDAQPYISPLHHLFKLSTPLFLHTGTAEAFHDDIENFAQQMARMNGSQVRFHATPLAPHCLFHTHKLFGMTDALDVAMKEACEFLERGA